MADNAGFYGEQTGRIAGGILALILGAKGRKKRKKAEEYQEKVLDARLKELQEAERTRADVEFLAEPPVGLTPIESMDESPAATALVEERGRALEGERQKKLTRLSTVLPNDRYENLLERMGIKSPEALAKEQAAANARQDEADFYAVANYFGLRGQAGITPADIFNAEQKAFAMKTEAGRKKALDFIDRYKAKDYKPEKSLGEMQREREAFLDRPLSEEEKLDLAGFKGKAEDTGFGMGELKGALQLQGTDLRPGPYAGASVKDIISAGRSDAAKIRKAGTPSSRVGELRIAEQAKAVPTTEVNTDLVATLKQAFQGPNAFAQAQKYYKDALAKGDITKEEYDTQFYPAMQAAFPRTK